MVAIDAGSGPRIARPVAGAAPVPRPVAPPVARPRRGEGDRTRVRVGLTMAAFGAVFLAIIGRLVQLGLEEAPAPSYVANAQDAILASRPDILDRNGEILATDIRIASLYAEPRRIVNVEEAMDAIAAVFPDLATPEMRERLSSDAGFIWIRREITPQQQEAVHRFGIPGFGFLTETQRFYPVGREVGHVVGMVNIDNEGLAGIESNIDQSWLASLHALGFARGEALEPVSLSLDLRVQHVMYDELTQAMARYQAIAAAGVVLNVNTGEVVAAVSLPDFDPNHPEDATVDNAFRVLSGTYEMGSVFKSFTIASALDSGRVSINDFFDAIHPLYVGNKAISDFHGQNRVLSVPEVFIYSSNIGTARIAVQMGMDTQMAYLDRFGLTSRLHTEIAAARPQVPAHPTQGDLMTMAFGHSIAVTPLQLVAAEAALMNGGWLMTPTFYPRSEEDALAGATQVVSAQTSAIMRQMTRLNVEDQRGSGNLAEVPGYLVGGKTGTAEKVVNGAYSSSVRLNSFLAAFPIDDPQYVVLVMLDEPKPERPGIGATAGLNTAPTAGAVIQRIAPMLGILPRFGIPDDYSLIPE